MSLAMLTPILGSTPVRSVPEAVSVLQAIEDALVPPATPPATGVAWFNRVYLAVTTSVQNSLSGPIFETPAYVAELDVIFANLYFAALHEYVGNPGAVPRAWWPVLAGSERTDVAPLQFVVAGMNAHINRDLPVALATLWNAHREAPSSLPDLAVQKRDYERVNALLSAIETEVKAWFLAGPWQELARTFHGVDDVIAMFSVAEAREAAWVQGEVLSSLGGPTSLLGARYLEAFDGVVGLAGRGLLIGTRR